MKKIGIEYSDLNDSATDLYLTMSSDRELDPMLFHRNLAIKKAKGIYNRKLAIKYFMYLVDRGELKYEFDHVNRHGKRHWTELKPSDLNRAGRIFDKEDKLEVAEYLTDVFEAEYSLGNYDRYLPKKWINPKYRIGAYKRKTQDEFIIQTYYPQSGWEDTTYCDDREDWIRTLKDYKLNQPQYMHRRVKKREKIVPKNIGSIGSLNLDNAIF